MSEFNIKIECDLCSGNIDYLYNHPEHKIKVSIEGINGKDYKTSYRSNVRWDFDDGYIVESPSASHYYTSSGCYFIKATLYGTDGSIHTTKVEPKQILVKSLISTSLLFLQNDKSSWNANRDYLISKNNFLGQLQISLDSNVSSEPKISAYRRDEFGDLKDKNYFEVKETPYYHLNPYYTFLEEQIFFTPDSSSSFTKVLKPVQKYSPSYMKVYAILSKGITKPNVFFYYINDKKLESNIIFYQINNNKVESVSCNYCSSESDLPLNAFECGKVGFTNIWYKNDNENKNDLLFEIEKASLKFVNETSLRESYLNIPPLGFSFNTIDELKLIKTQCFKALTNNGLYIPQENINYKIDPYLEHNFYKGYTVNGYYSYFIENDILDNKKSFNMLKSKWIEGGSLDIFSNDYNCIIEKQEDKSYYKKYSFCPLTPFSIYDNNGEIYKCDELKDFSSLVLPREKQHSEDLDEVLTTYMSHPVFENTPKLKTFLKDSLNNNGLFDRIINKGLNFLDDHNNIKTCYINNLLDVYKMLDEPLNNYNLTSFDKINELKDLMRIFSMNYSTLFGNLIETDYDISVNHMSTGKNVGDKLEKDDIFLCDKDYKLIGFKREGNVYQLIEPVEYIIIKDDFNFRTHLASFYKIETSLIELFEDQAESWTEENKDFISRVKYSYSLDNYNYKWGWALNLPEETKNINRKSEFIDNYYSFYLLNSQNNKIRKYNFLEEKFLPSNKDGNQLSVKQWNEKFGFVYDCLMKVLCEKLNEIK